MDVTVNLQDLLNILKKTSNRELETVVLNPSLQADLVLNPEDTLATPYVMTSFMLVPSLSYRFGYYDYGYLLLGYVLERGGNYESGQFEVVSNAPRFDPQTEVFSEPTLWARQTKSILTGGSLGVDLGVAYDESLSQDGVRRFGITYKITNDLPQVFPKLRMFYIGALTT